MTHIGTLAKSSKESILMCIANIIYNSQYMEKNPNVHQQMDG